MVDIGALHLFEPPAPTHLTLAGRFLVPPFSVLDARAGYWQDRKRDWLNLGIRGEEGRSAGLTGNWDAARAFQKGEYINRDVALLASEGFAGGTNGDDPIVSGFDAGTSIFDPVVCELAYRWFSPQGGKVLDPFAGGSVRGIVAGCLERDYLGVDLRPEQCAANEQQRDAISNATPFPYPPAWVCDDSGNLPYFVDEQAYDFVFSCPPYYDLEQYSDDPRDLSNADDYQAFRCAYQEIIGHTVAALKPDRYACFVVGEVRGKTGAYCGLVPDTIAAFAAAGAALYNEAILVTSVGSLPIRTSRAFGVGRKLGKTHQNILVFCKGDGRKAADACGPVPEVALEYGGAVWRADGSAVTATGERWEPT